MDNVTADLALPHEFTAKSIEFVTPESPDTVPLKFSPAKGQFAVPKFLVYGVVRVLSE